MILAGRDWYIVVDPKEMANGTKGRDRPLPLDSLPVGGQTRLSPHTPLGNWVAWYLVFLGCAGY